MTFPVGRSAILLHLVHSFLAVHALRVQPQIARTAHVLAQQDLHAQTPRVLSPDWKNGPGHGVGGIVMAGDSTPTTPPILANGRIDLTQFTARSDLGGLPVQGPVVPIAGPFPATSKTSPILANGRIDLTHFTARSDIGGLPAQGADATQRALAPDMIYRHGHGVGGVSNSDSTQNARFPALQGRMVPIAGPFPAYDYNTTYNKTIMSPLCRSVANFTVGGRDVGRVLSGICEWWPSVLGVFPAAHLLKARAAIDAIHEKINGIKQSAAELGFCVRPAVLRPTITAPGNACPQRFTWSDLRGKTGNLSKEFPRADLESLKNICPEGRVFETQFRCRDASRAWFGQAKCNCDREDALEPSSTVRQIAPLPTGCDLIREGVCIGSCPAGHAPTPENYEVYRASCIPVCPASAYPVECGSGCATSLSTCVSLRYRQVKETVSLALTAVKELVVGTVVSVYRQRVSAWDIGRFAKKVLWPIAKIVKSFRGFKPAVLAVIGVLSAASFDDIRRMCGDILKFVKMFTNIILSLERDDFERALNVVWQPAERMAAIFVPVNKCPLNV